ncbi:acyltransferase family protein [Sphingoaurantiacus capsulatus]|uniref:Acyltransferase family protein n=1 Tax=Sphingoaurantiacus capsulatus TaxID=1771310 RepID=A0ABV7XFB6_9SPHN
MRAGSVDRTNNFDLLRLAAATQVLLTHGAHHLKLATPAWWPILESLPGVPIFFVISGFLVSDSYERSRSLGNYLGKRAIRIYPALWCCIVATVVVAALHGFDFLHWPALGWFVAQCVGLIYTPDFLRDFGFGSYNGALWTIPIELQFYVVLPILYAVARRIGGERAVMVGAFVGFLALAVGLRLALDGPEGPVEKLIRYSFLPHFFLFLAGLLLRQAGVQRSHWIAGRGLWWLAAYLLAMNLLPGGDLLHFASRLLLAVAVVALAFSAPALSDRVLRGQDFSYGIYIYHGLMMNLLIEQGLMGSVAAYALLILLSSAAGVASWFAVERPLLRRKSRPAGIAIEASEKTAW